MVLLVAGLYACGGSGEHEEVAEQGQGAVRAATQSLVMPQDVQKVAGMLKGLWEQTASGCDTLGQNCDTTVYANIVFMGKNCLVGTQRSSYEVSNDTIFFGDNRLPVQVLHITPSELVCNWLTEANIMRYSRRRRESTNR